MATRAAYCRMTGSVLGPPASRTRTAATAAGRRRIGKAIAAIGVAALAAGCTSASGASNQAAAGLEKTTIVVGAVPAVDSAGLYIAEQRGYFTAVGLHVKIMPIVSSGGETISRQLAGGYDITLGNYVSYVEADAEQDAGLRIIAEGSVMQPGYQEIMTLPGSRITSLAGLRRATLAVNVKNNIGTILIGSLLAENGLSLSQVKLVAIPFPEMTAALKDHKVDAAWLPEPFLSLAEEQIGAQEVADLDQGGVAGFPVVGFAVTRAWERKYPRTEAAFLSALDKGQAAADSNRVYVEQAVESFLGVSPGTAALMALPTYPSGVDQVRLQRVADAMLSFGLLKQAYKVRQMIG